MAKAVRITIDPRTTDRKRRTVDERLIVRWPGLFRWAARGLTRIPPRSRLRQAILRRRVAAGWAAWSRGDLDLLLVGYAPNGRIDPVTNMLGAGMDRSYLGHAGIRELSSDWRDAWGDIGVTPLEVLDFGDRLITVGRGHVRARDTGIEFAYDVYSVVWLEDGMVVRQADFVDQDEAFQAMFAGVSGDLE